MADLIYLGISLLFFTATFALIWFFDWVQGEQS